MLDVLAHEPYGAIANQKMGATMMIAVKTLPHFLFGGDNTEIDRSLRGPLERNNIVTVWTTTPCEPPAVPDSVPISPVRRNLWRQHSEKTDLSGHSAI